MKPASQDNERIHHPPILSLCPFAILSVQPKITPQVKILLPKLVLGKLHKLSACLSFFINVKST